MKRTVIVMALVALACGGDAPREANLPPAKPMCVMKGYPAPAEVRPRKQLKVGRQTYGSVAQITSVMVGQARKAHADAIVNYNGSQRFGFWPWRFIRPVATGEAVRMDNIGGVRLREAWRRVVQRDGRLGSGEIAPEMLDSEYQRGRREERERLERERETEGGR